MKIVDVGNIDDDKFYIEFDKRPSLEDAAKLLASEYKEIIGCSKISYRGPLDRESPDKGEDEVYFLLEIQYGNPQLELVTTEGDTSPVFDVRRASSSAFFQSLHSYLQRKYCPDSEE